MLGRTDSRARLVFLLVTFVIVAGSLGSRLAWWQIVQRGDLEERARAQTSLTAAEPSRRGAIYDRSGTVLLATTVDRFRLAVAPKTLSLERRGRIAAELVTILELTGAEATDLAAKMASDREYVVLARDIEPKTARKIREAVDERRVANVILEPEPVRTYPQSGGDGTSTLAAHLLGFVNREGLGQYGVEQRYQDVLAGSPRLVMAQKDVASRAIPETIRVLDPGVDGVDLRLTIDAGLQVTVEQELLAAWIADRAVSISAVVIDPYTGEVYAHATYPSYDANQYKAIAESAPSRFVDPIVSAVYEPGSVFKMMTAVAALERGVVTPKTRIHDTGTLRLDKGTSKIDDADRKAMGWLSFEDVVAYSRNVGAAKVALKLGKTTKQASTALHDTWVRLGFGQPTGIDVAGEVPGLVRDPADKRWAQIDLANGSFGQGVAVTPIQLAVAYAAMVNGGHLVQPHVVKAIGDHELAPPLKAERVMPTNLRRTLIRLMNHVVTEVPFYRDRTLVKGYYVGGKTGTAQIWDPTARGGRGAWKHNLFNYSFVGYIGREVEAPELIVAVRIEEARPTVARVGQLEMPVMSFELFRRIATDAITTLDLPHRGPAASAPATADR